jgi:hypothetical protein
MHSKTVALLVIADMRASLLVIADSCIASPAMETTANLKILIHLRILYNYPYNYIIYL